MDELKLVEFDKYCDTCVNKDVEESDPYKKCHDCLSIPAREYSHTPEYYKKKEK